MADRAKLEVELLGVSTMSQKRERSDKELQRAAACLRTIRLLSYVRLPFARYLNAVRAYAVSKVAYGWISRWPTLQLSKRIWAAVNVGFRRVRSAAPWFGGSMHLDVLFATRLVGCFARAGMKRVLASIPVSGSPSHALDTWLRRRGWTRDRPWVWRHKLTGESINLSHRRVVPGRLQHAVRNAWRAWCLLQHAATNRRDVDHVDCFVGGRLRVGYFRRIDGRALVNGLYLLSGSRHLLRRCLVAC